jgi:hypothetical protein
MFKQTKLKENIILMFANKKRNVENLGPVYMKVGCPSGHQKQTESGSP